ncbi:MAG TPA: helix-turn-helix transcriptional regulator [Flavisolibacter sp.]|nr:helix-turn-helix transcriptional regulator [Flavisolibacter sp.]
MVISGELLQKLRLLKGIKQETIAKKLGISQPRYCQLEKKARIQGDLLANLIKALNYTTEEAEELEKKLYR